MVGWANAAETQNITAELARRGYGEREIGLLWSGNFLRVMDARLSRGERAIQAYYAVRDPARSWTVSLRYAALAVLHYLRPLGRAALEGKFLATTRCSGTCRISATSRANS